MLAFLKVPRDLLRLMLVILVWMPLLAAQLLVGTLIVYLGKD